MINQEHTASGATINRDSGNGQFAPKQATESHVELSGFGLPTPQFILRDQDENPVAFSEEFCANHGHRIARDMEHQARGMLREHPTDDMAELLDDLRCAYPVFNETAGPDDYQSAVTNLRQSLSSLPPLEAEKRIEQVTFGVHMEMEHWKNPHFQEDTSNGWADLTPAGAEFDDPSQAQDFNREEWARLTEKAAVAATKAIRD